MLQYRRGSEPRVLGGKNPFLIDHYTGKGKPPFFLIIDWDYERDWYSIVNCRQAAALLIFVHTLIDVNFNKQLNSLMNNF